MVSIIDIAMGRAIARYYCDSAAQEFYELRLQVFQTPRSISVSITADSMP